MNKMPCLKRDFFAALNRLALDNSFSNVELPSIELLNEDST